MHALLYGEPLQLGHKPCGPRYGRARQVGPLVLSSLYQLQLRSTIRKERLMSTVPRPTDCWLANARAESSKGLILQLNTSQLEVYQVQLDL
jgi:hypothetical protein